MILLQLSHIKYVKKKKKAEKNVNDFFFNTTRWRQYFLFSSILSKATFMNHLFLLPMVIDVVCLNLCWDL